MITVLHIAESSIPTKKKSYGVGVHGFIAEDSDKLVAMTAGIMSSIKGYQTRAQYLKGPQDHHLKATSVVEHYYRIGKKRDGLISAIVSAIRMIIQKGYDGVIVYDTDRPRDILRKNHPDLYKVKEAIDIAKEKNIKITLERSPSKDTNPGIDICKLLANIAINGGDSDVKTYDDVKGYWRLPDVRHPLVAMNRIVRYTSNKTPKHIHMVTGKHLFDIGKKHPALFYGVAQVDTNPVFDLLLSKLRTGCHNVVNTDMICNKKVHHAIQRYGESAIQTVNSPQYDEYFLAGSEILLGQTMYPPGLVERAHVQLSGMGKLLDRLTPEDCTDITEKFYDVEKEIVLPILTSKPRVRVDTINRRPVNGTCGMDLPDRNRLKRLEKLHPKIYLYYDEFKPGMLRYYFIITCDTGKAIYTGYYINITKAPVKKK